MYYTDLIIHNGMASLKSILIFVYYRFEMHVYFAVPSVKFGHPLKFPLSQC